MQRVVFAILFLLTVATAPVSAQVVFPQYPTIDTPSTTAWYPDRFPPAVFINASTQNGRNNVLRAGVAAADGQATRVPPFNGTFYNTQGRKIDVGTPAPVSWIGSLYIPSAWGAPDPANGSGSRRTELWANVGPDFPVIGFTNATDVTDAPGTTPRYRIFDPDVGFVNLAPPVSFDAWTDFCVTWNGTSFEYRIGDQIVATLPGTASSVLVNVIVNTYNFGYTYDAQWSNIAAGNATCQELRALFVTGTTTAVVPSLNPSAFGQAVTFTATVTGTSPTGTVQFLDGATVLGDVPLAGTTATLTTSSLAVGTHPITAVYSGDADDLGSTSPVVSQVVNAGLPGATATALVSSLSPSVSGQGVTFTATVTGTSPTGSVQFRDGATVLGDVALVGTTATFTTSSLAVGTHPITAVYSGDADDATSTSPVVNQVITAMSAGVTTTALVSSPNPSVSGQAVTFTATVTGTSPTGGVQFRDGATILGDVALAGTTATFTTSLAVGTHSITAVYSGDADDAVSTSPAVQQVVNGGPAPPPSGVQPIPVLPWPLLGLLVALLGALGTRNFRQKR